MKFLVSTLLLTTVALSRTIVPSRIVTPSLDIFSSRNKVLPNGDVRVEVTGNSESEYFTQNADKIILTRAQFDAYQKLSRGVFGNYFDGSYGNDKLIGTVFSIGNNLILTNHHVLDPEFRNTSHCDGLKVRDHNGVSFQCRKVHFCQAKLDVCLIEMTPKSVPVRTCIFCLDVPKHEVSLGEQDSLKLKSSYSLEFEEAENEVLTAIGNTLNMGIHFSQGRGAVISSDYIRFWAPSTTGNSGGPLLNDEGLVVGIVKHESRRIGGDRVSEEFGQTYNGAVPSGLVIRVIRDALKNDPVTLKKFNQAVVE